MKALAPALVKAKRAFGPALKVKTNPAFKSKYADLGACLDAVDAPCLDNGIVVYQETSEDETGVTVETVFLHESGEALRCGKLHVPASKQDPQGYGSALSYARRYSLMTACGIAAARKPEARQPDVAAILSGIMGSATVEILKANFEAAMQMLDPKHHETIVTAKNSRYKQLTTQKEPA
jgi:hypothetical protein